MSTIHHSALVEADSIGAGVSIAELAVVRAGAVLGDGVIVHPHVVIEAGVEVGSGTEVLPGSHLGRAPRATRAIARDPSFERRLVIGAGCAIGAHAVIYYDVEIGDETLLGDGASIREKCRIGSGSVVGRYATLDRGVTVGDGSRLMDKAHLTGETSVGDGVFIASLVGSTNDSSFGRQGYGDDVVRGPKIEDGAMIGGSASLLPGVVVGRSAIVGSGAVVTKDVEPGTMVLGVPARPVEQPG